MGKIFFGSAAYKQPMIKLRESGHRVSQLLVAGQAQLWQKGIIFACFLHVMFMVGILPFKLFPEQGGIIYENSAVRRQIIKKRGALGSKSLISIRV